MPGDMRFIEDWLKASDPFSARWKVFQDFSHGRYGNRTVTVTF